ncbi:MAG TPA: CRISPR-associated protein Cas4 [Treponemataceae bacterium]|nr:CRISPR-associated protein Cas4 [Treponemataceae bacterium]
MFSEDDLIPVSGLQHVLFCERQLALIHVEQIWAENRFTEEGRVLHEHVDIEHHESRRLYKQEFAMGIRSLKLGLIGKCDLVEFYLDLNLNPFEVIPVEFKRGSKKIDDYDCVQVCAQAICLEEMLSLAIPRGQIYYLQEHRRTIIDLDRELREKTVFLIGKAREIIEKGITPVVEYNSKKCDRCSLFDLCMPKKTGAKSKNVDRYVRSQIRISQEMII